MQARLTATQAGLGVMGVFVPPYAVEDLTSRLRPLRLEAPSPQVEFGLVLPPPHAQTSAAQQLAEWLRTVSASGPAAKGLAPLAGQPCQPSEADQPDSSRTSLSR